MPKPTKGARLGGSADRATADHYTRFIGAEGWVEAGFGHIKASDPGVLQVPLGEDKIRLPRKDEKRDFIDCVKSREQPVADAEVGHRTNSIGLLGVIAAQLGTPLTWDPARETFTSNDDANKLLERPLREPWTLLWDRETRSQCPSR